MAPEQLAGRAADARSDQYSLALALAEALLGERPLPGATAEDLETLRVERGRAAVPIAATRAVARALSVRPTDRFADLSELEAALHAEAPPEARAVTLRPAHADAGGDGTRARPAQPGARPLVVLAGTVAVSLGVWAATSLGTGSEQEATGPVASPPVEVVEPALPEPSASPAASASASPSSEASEVPRRDVAQGAPVASGRTTTPSGSGSVGDPSLLLLKARRASDGGDPKGCVAGHDALAAADAAFAARAPIQRERAKCEMLAGQCDAGRQRMRGLLAGSYSPVALEAALDAVTVGSCPKGNTKRPPKAIVSVEDARALFGEAQAASQAADVAKCRRVGLDATRLAEPGQPIEVSSMLAGAIALTNDCLSKNGDCATARKNFVAQYPKLYPQIVALGVDEAQREAMFSSSFPQCKRSP
jgi:hypothetical protein